MAKAQGDVFSPPIWRHLRPHPGLPFQSAVRTPRALPRHQGVSGENLDLVEIHLSYKDLEVNLDR